MSRPRARRKSRRRSIGKAPAGRRAVELHWRARLACERGTPKIIPPADCQVALVYPNTYAVGMSSLGYQMVYRWINAHPAALAERFFCEGRPALSVENQRPLDQFDAIAFSVAYELDYLNVVRFLADNRIAVTAAERDPAAEPLILVGGICLSVNRLPIYDLADVLVVGDGEGVLGRILDEWVASDGDRARCLKAIQAIEGVEVTEGACRRYGIESLGRHEHLARDPGRGTAQPQLPNPNLADSLDSAEALSMIVTPDAELADRCLIEIARGCPYRCRFCFIGHCGRHRPRPFEAVCEMIERGRESTRRFGLVAAAVGSHPEIVRICEHCLAEGLDVSFSSLRVEDVKPAILDVLVAGGQKAVTIAPEAGSERLRRQLGKMLGDEQIVEFAASAAGRGLTDLRLYFMVGLPGEEPDDIDAIVRLAEATQKAAALAHGAGRRRPTLAVNVSIYVPKPGTALAGEQTPPPTQIKRHLRRLNASLGRIDGVEYRAPSLAEAQAQKTLAWGGRETLQLLIETAGAGHAWRRVLGRGANVSDEVH